MTKNLNLRIKIIVAYFGLTLLLSSLCIVGVIIATQISEEKEQKSRIKMDAEYFLSDYLSSFTAPGSNSFNAAKPSSPFITYYYGEDLLPEWVFAELPDIKQGTYFIDNDKQKYCLLIKNLPDGENFYLLYNVTRQNKDTGALHSLQMTILMTLAPILVFGIFVGLITAHKVIGPVLRLEKYVRNVNPGQRLPEDFEEKFSQDEVGFLAAAFKKSINNMQESIERETSFARDASHELRTPVTTIKNSLELLEELDPDLDERTRKIIGRITRSAASMEHLIKSFLWLSRQNRLDQFKSTEFAVYELVQEVVQEQSYLVERKEIIVNVFDSDRVKLKTERQLMKILIANLVRNAFTYTNEGYVDIVITRTCVHVRDSGVGIKEETLTMLKDGRRDASSKGFGLGIAIVKRLCGSLGWAFYIKSEEGKGTQTRICYNVADACHDCDNFFVQTAENA